MIALILCVMLTTALAYRGTQPPTTAQRRTERYHG